MKTITTTIISFLTFLTPHVALANSAEHVQASLITEVESIQAGEPFWVGINLKMDSGWHTYWRQAGDTGFPTSIEWQLPEGFQASDIYWPVPEKLIVDGLVNFIYEKEVLLLVQITPSADLDPNQSIRLNADVQWLACKESCIPEGANLELSLAVKDSKPIFNSKWNKAFDLARKNLPQKLNTWTVDAYFANETYGLFIQPNDEVKNQDLPNSIEFFSHNNDIQLSESQKLEKTSNGYFLKLPLENDVPTKLEGILVNTKGWDKENKVHALAIDIKGHKEIPSLSKVEKTSSISLSSALMFAFLGGLILNLMPCVFPVLGLKVMSFLKYAAESPWKARMHGLIFTFGVLISFWALSGLLLILKAGGSHVGWGFQLQSPYFIAFLCFLLLILSLNFLGTFEMGISLMSAGNKLNNSSGYVGTFLSGVLATVLATPCTGPFMGTALGFTLTQPAIFSLGIFTAIALGMSAPYLIFTFFPSLLKYLPRPGAWMETFKQAMAFPLLATVLWLLWVFGQQTDLNALTGLLFGLLLASLAAWIYGRFATFSASTKKRSIASIASLVFLIIGIALAYTSAKIDHNASHVTTEYKNTIEGLNWEKFSQERLEELQAEGRAVFVDFTAAWCLTCQTNKKNVFSSDKVIEKLKEKNVVLLHADWTRRDPEITKALESHGRNGVPTNVFYPAKEKDTAIAVVLPELLTPSVLLETLK